MEVSLPSRAHRCLQTYAYGLLRNVTGCSGQCEKSISVLGVESTNLSRPVNDQLTHSNRKGIFSKANRAYVQPHSPGPPLLPLPPHNPSQTKPTLPRIQLPSPLYTPPPCNAHEPYKYSPPRPLNYPPQKSQTPANNAPDSACYSDSPASSAPRLHPLLNPMARAAASPAVA